MTARDLLKEGIRTLAEHSLTDAEISARLLLCHILGWTSAQLVTQINETVNEEQQTAFLNAIERRSNHEPVDYIIGQKNFRGLSLTINNQTLIPRSETEQLVGLVTDYLTAHPLTEDDQIIEIGTGSGAISLALADYLKQTSLPGTIIATDISKGALSVAQNNAPQLGLVDRITFLQADLLPTNNVQPTIIVANLPYVPTDRIAALAPEVRDFEPHLALDGGPDGLNLYHHLFQQIIDRQLSPHALFLEIDETHGQKVTELAQRLWPTASITITQDLAGFDRFASILLK